MRHARGPYQLALAQRLAHLGHHVLLDPTVMLVVDGGPATTAYHADIIVDGTLVLEVKSAKAIPLRHIMQTKTYLRLGGFPLGYGFPRSGV